MSRILVAVSSPWAAEKVGAKWVVPMHYRVPGLKTDLDGVETFLKEMGATEAVAQGKLVVQYSGSGGDGETKVFLLEPRL